MLVTQLFGSASFKSKNAVKAKTATAAADDGCGTY